MHPKTSLIFSFFLFTFFIGVTAWSVSSPQHLFNLGWSQFGEHKIHISGMTFLVALADTDKERQKGLGGIKRIGDKQGMLFVFDRSERWRIWMKDMKFDIDIIWISEGGKVVDIARHVYVDTYPEVFEPQESAKYVLEINADAAEAFGINVGDNADLNL
jgi:uncharacterized membrane protein (UPF0127 family)